MSTSHTCSRCRPIFTTLGDMTDAALDEVMNPQHFGSDPVDIHRHGSESGLDPIRIRIMDHLIETPWRRVALAALSLACRKPMCH